MVKIDWVIHHLPVFRHRRFHWRSASVYDTKRPKRITPLSIGKTCCFQTEFPGEPASSPPRIRLLKTIKRITVTHGHSFRKGLWSSSDLTLTSLCLKGCWIKKEYHQTEPKRHTRSGAAAAAVAAAAGYSGCQPLLAMRVVAASLYSEVRLERGLLQGVKQEYTNGALWHQPMEMKLEFVPNLKKGLHTHCSRERPLHLLGWKQYRHLRTPRCVACRWWQHKNSNTVRDDPCWLTLAFVHTNGSCSNTKIIILLDWKYNALICFVLDGIFVPQSLTIQKKNKPIHHSL